MASNIDCSILDSACSKIISNSIIDKEIKIPVSLNSNGDLLVGNNVDFVVFDETDHINPLVAHILN